MERDNKGTDDVTLPPIEDGKPLVQSGPKVIPKTTGQVFVQCSNLNTICYYK